MPRSASSAAATTPWNPEGGGFPTLFERYQILGIIGQGGMGTVFKGYHLNLKRFVAIKTLRVEHLKNAELLKRFMREVELVGQMDHANVVRATDAGEKNGVFYLVMEFLNGSDLSRLVAEHGPLTVADSCELVLQTALGLDYVHRTLVHRDIKPSNLMLTTSGLVKILDLGLARCDFVDTAEAEQTPHGVAVGTYSYMAPEQAKAGAAADGRADIYSLGCTLFKLVTGKAPFSGPEYDHPVQQMHAHAAVSIASLPAFQQVPEVLRPIIVRMTAKKAEQRYGSGREVAEVLAPLAEGSRPLSLLKETDATLELPPRPLPEPLPDVLSRLTYTPETSRSDPTGPAPPTPIRDTIVTRSTARSVGGWSRARLTAVLAGCIVCAAALVAGIVYWRPPAERTPAPSSDESAPKKQDPPPAAARRPRLLDELPSFIQHDLFDQMPLPVGAEAENRSQWVWDAATKKLRADGNASLVFPLGTTTRTRYAFQAGITQNPPSGRVGIFWGYHEDAEAKKARKPSTTFAWFQTLSLSRGTALLKGKDRDDDTVTYVDSVIRGRAILKYNKYLEITMDWHIGPDQQVRLGPREIILSIMVEGNRLKHARIESLGLESIELKELCTDRANKLFTVNVDHYHGDVGVFSMQQHHATFSNVQFRAASNN